MKKILLLSALLAGSLLINKPAEAQFRVHVNINTRPVWEHRVHDPFWNRRDERFFEKGRGGGYYHRDFDNRDRRREHDRYDDRRHDRGRRDDRHDNDRRGGNDNDHRNHDDNRGHGKGGDRW